jgi:hypothetical protein
MAVKSTWPVRSRLEANSSVVGDNNERRKLQMKIQVFDPPMCCSTGVCGPSINPELVRFAADLDWLRGQGVEVHRSNLSQQPADFANSPVVRATLAADGNDCLPLTLADGKVVHKGSYPTREMLSRFAGLETAQGTGEQKVSPCCCSAESDKDKKPGKGRSCC